MANEIKLDVEIDSGSQTSTFGRFTIQPLERGFGTTIGNALRRVLLTSIPGAAITNVKFDTVVHEFSTIKGVKDDVADIIMNLKGVKFKLMDHNPDKVELTLSGKKVVTAKDIQAKSDQFVILNPDHYITEINDEGELKLELWIGIGKGYVPSEENEMPSAPIGVIAIDSIFNPVSRVIFKSTPLPGAKESQECLTIDVETNGAISPKDALSHASTILKEHFQFIEAISRPEVLEVTDDISSETVAIRGLLNSTIEEMELSVRSFNCLQAAGIRYIHELVSKEESEMLKYKNFGRKSLTELVEKLDEMGLQFGMDVDKYLKEEL